VIEVPDPRQGARCPGSINPGQDKAFLQRLSLIDPEN